MAYVYNLKTGLATVARDGEMKRPNADLRLISPAVFNAINKGVISKTEINGFFTLATMQNNPHASADVLLNKRGEVDASDVRNAPETAMPAPDSIATPDHVQPYEQVEPDDFTAIIRRINEEGPGAVNSLSSDALIVLAENIGVDVKGKTTVKQLRPAIIAKLKEIQDATED